MDEFTNKKIKYRFAKVGKDFRLIEQNTKTIFINCEEDADEILRELKEKDLQDRECERRVNIVLPYMTRPLTRCTAPAC